MEIRLSRYLLPFSETPENCVHYIPVDFQQDILTGNLSAHVQLWRSQHSSDESVYGFYDPQNWRSPNPEPVIDYAFLDDLFYNSGVKAAGKRVGRYS